MSESSRRRSSVVWLEAAAALKAQLGTFVQRLRGYVSVVWPDNCARLGIGTKLPEVANVPKWLEDTAVVEEVGEIYLGSQAVLKFDVDTAIIPSFGVNKQWRTAHGWMIVPHPNGSIGIKGRWPRARSQLSRS